MSYSVLPIMNDLYNLNAELGMEANLFTASNAALKPSSIVSTNSLTNPKL